MNEQENTRSVQQAYQSIKAGEIPSLLNSLAEGVQWQLPEMENVPFAGKWQGREQVGQFFSTLAEVQDILEFEPKEFVAQGDKVVVLGRFSMRTKSTDTEFGSDWAHVWTVKGGKVTNFREYVDTAAVSGAHRRADRLTQWWVNNDGNDVLALCSRAHLLPKTYLKSGLSPDARACGRVFTEIMNTRSRAKE